MTSLYFDNGLTYYHYGRRNQTSGLFHSTHSEYRSDDHVHQRPLPDMAAWIRDGVEAFEAFWGFRSKVESSGVGVWGVGCSDARTHARTHARALARTHARARARAPPHPSPPPKHVRTHARTRAHTQTHKQTHSHARTHTRTHAHAHTHKRTHTHKHTHTHTSQCGVDAFRDLSQCNRPFLLLTLLY